MDQTTSSDTHSPTQTDLISTIPLPPSRRNSNKRFTNHSIVTSPIKTGDKHGDYLWSNIISRVSPIFHGENIKGCIEDLNELVSVYQKEGNLDVLHSNISTMCNSGVDVLHKKLIQSTSNSSLPNDSLIIAAKVSELWSYFFTVVLPVLLASFLPFKQSGLDINIREISLTAFRNVIVLPLSSNFDDAFIKLPPISGNSSNDISARLRQMFLVLNSVSNSQVRDSNSQVLFEMMNTLNKSLIKRTSQNELRALSLGD